MWWSAAIVEPSVHFRFVLKFGENSRFGADFKVVPPRLALISPRKSNHIYSKAADWLDNRLCLQQQFNRRQTVLWAGSAQDQMSYNSFIPFHVRLLLFLTSDDGCWPKKGGPPLWKGYGTLRPVPVDHAQLRPAG